MNRTFIAVTCIWWLAAWIYLWQLDGFWDVRTLLCMGAYTLYELGSTVYHYVRTH